MVSSPDTLFPILPVVLQVYISQKKKPWKLGWNGIFFENGSHWANKDWNVIIEIEKIADLAKQSIRLIFTVKIKKSYVGITIRSAVLTDG